MLQICLNYIQFHLYVRQCFNIIARISDQRYFMMIVRLLILFHETQTAHEVKNSSMKKINFNIF